MGLYWPKFSLVFLIHLFVYAGVYCIAYWIPASFALCLGWLLINVLYSDPKENNTLTSLKSKRRRRRLSSPVRQQKTADVEKSWHRMKCGRQTVERRKIYMYHQPSDSQLVRIIKFVSVADKNWNRKILFIKWTCCEVRKTVLPRGLDTLSALPCLF